MIEVALYLAYMLFIVVTNIILFWKYIFFYIIITLSLTNKYKDIDWPIFIGINQKRYFLPFRIILSVQVLTLIIGFVAIFLIRNHNFSDFLELWAVWIAFFLPLILYFLFQGFIINRIIFKKIRNNTATKDETLKKYQSLFDSDLVDEYKDYQLENFKFLKNNKNSLFCKLLLLIIRSYKKKKLLKINTIDQLFLFDKYFKKIIFMLFFIRETKYQFLINNKEVNKAELLRFIQIKLAIQ